MYKVEEARRIVIDLWREWPRKSDPPNSEDMFGFFCHLEGEGSHALNFRCKGDKWQRVHGWLLQHEGHRIH